MIVSHLHTAGASNARRTTVAIAIVFAAIAGGCASDSSSFFTTGSLIEPTPVIAPAPKPDPACVSLSAQIDALKKEGTVERLEKAADGKTQAVNVQRAALAKQAQLNKLNADFVAKCGPTIPKAATTAAAATPQQPAAVKTAAVAPTKATTAATKAAAKTTGVTIAPATGVQN